MWVIKCHCGTSVPGDTQSSAAQPHVGGPALLGGLRTHRCPSGLAILGVWGLLWSCDTHTDLHPKSISSSPFYSPEMPPLSEWQHSFIWELAGFLSTLHTKLLLLHYLGGNEALNSFTWIFQSLQRSSSSSHTHTKTPSTESYREQQNLVLRLTWK